MIDEWCQECWRSITKSNMEIESSYLCIPDILHLKSTYNHGHDVKTFETLSFHLKNVRVD